VETTTDNLTGRGGLALFVKYLNGIGIYSLLDESFGKMRKSLKGQAIWNIFKQVICFFFDGTNRHVNYFDHLRKDEGYMSVIENNQREMLSSHAVKRFFKGFSWLCGGMFRKILKRMFIWRLKLEKPDKIIMTIDTMVMDNDEAACREGVQPTYKKVKGFQPLQLIWKGKIVDAIFRGGKKHSNYGNSVVNMITDMVELIRREYRPDITIIVQLDSGFFDEDNFTAFDALNIGFICTGKMYEGVKEQAQSRKDWGVYDNGHQVWEFAEFGFRCDKWNRFYRAIYTRPVYEGTQKLLDFSRPDNVIVTNIGVNHQALAYATKEQKRKWIKPETLVRTHHLRGADELPHRGLKDFGFEELPFKRFAPNSAFYYCMLVSFFLFETYKEDVLCGIVPMVSYATTVRRQVVDWAAKIIRRGGQIILKVTRAVMAAWHVDELWARCQNPPPIVA
jgi:hypothetical protein